MFYERIPSLFGDCTSRVGWAHGEHFNSYKNFKVRMSEKDTFDFSAAAATSRASKLGTEV